jgi:uncharacterized protein
VDKAASAVHSKAQEIFAWSHTLPVSPESAARPLIWVLKGLRAGDTAQAMHLALQLNGRVEGKQLSFNALHALPNWLAGPRVSHLTRDAQQLLRPPWPDLVVSTGRRTAAAALWIKRQSGGRTKIVLLGRPRMPLQYFDLVVTTPQYGLPLRSNVLEIPLPLVGPKQESGPALAAFSQIWSDLPRPWILAVIGGGKFPVRLDARDLAGFGGALDRRARHTGGSVIVVDSPRSPEQAVERVGETITGPKWLFRRGQSDNPYQPALALCDELVVTSDSVSMVTEMLLTAKPVSIYRLPVSRMLPQWSAQSGPGAALAAAGILNPPRNVDGFMQQLIERGLIGDVAAGSQSTQSFIAGQSQSEVVQRVRSLLNVEALT